MALNVGSIHAVAVKTADAVIGTSGGETIVFAVTIKGGSALTTAKIYSGTDATGTLQEDAIAPINGTVFIQYPNGVHYPAGCFLDITTSGGSVTIAYNQ